MSSLTSLRNALSSQDENQIRSALSAYLKEDYNNDPNTSVWTQPEPINQQCGIEGVDASVCAEIISDCLAGDSTKCTNTLQRIVASGKLAGGIKNMNGEMARKIINILGIRSNSSSPIQDWINSLGSAGQDIANNGPLMTIISSFVTYAQNPLTPTSSLNFSRNRVALLASPGIPVRIPRFVASGGAGQTGGSISTFNTYQQYADSLRTYVSMQNGGNPHHTKVYDEFSSMYNSFVDSLKNKGKKIDDNDDATIRRTLDELRSVETKLGKVVSYISKYEDLQRVPEFKDELAKNPVTVDLLAELNRKYSELKAKHQSKSARFISWTDALNKIMEQEGEINELKARVGAPAERASSGPAPMFPPVSASVSAPASVTGASAMFPASAPAPAPASASAPASGNAAAPTGSTINKYYSY